MRDKDICVLIRRYSFYLLTLDQQLKYTRASYVRLLLIYSILPVAQTIGSYYDNALVLLGDNNRGLLEHYGQWSVFLAPPLLVYLASLALKRITVAAKDIANYSVNREIPAKVTEVIERHVGYFELRGGAKWFFLSLVALGAGVSAINFVQTCNPFRAFGNDTFDSIHHLWGFLFTRISNTLLYTLLFPVLIFEVLLTTLMLARVLRTMVSEGALCIDFFNKDQCGGMSAFGFINVLIMLFWSIVFCIIVADFVVQREVATTLVFSAVFCATLFIAQSIWGVYSIHTCVQSKKSEALTEIERALRSITEGELQVNRVLKYIMVGQRPLERIPPIMQLREVVLSTRTVPYTRNAAIAVYTMRIAPPIVLAIIRLLA